MARDNWLDGTANAQKVISYAHAETHAGSHYFFNFTDEDFDTGDTLHYILTVADTTAWPHFTIDIESALDTTVVLYEDTTHTANVAQTVYNHNRNSANTAGMTVHTATLGGSAGTQLKKWVFGLSSGGIFSSVKEGGAARSDKEIILKQGAKYYITISTGTDDSRLTGFFDWYEHTNI